MPYIMLKKKVVMTRQRALHTDSYSVEKIVISFLPRIRKIHKERSVEYLKSMPLLSRCPREEFSVSINSYCICAVLFRVIPHPEKFKKRKLSLKNYKGIPKMKSVTR